MLPAIFRSSWKFSPPARKQTFAPVIQCPADDEKLSKYRGILSISSYFVIVKGMDS